MVNQMVHLVVLCLALIVVPAESQPSRVQAVAKSSSGYEKRYALVIGNADYKYMPRLENPRNDARDMCAALNKLGFESMCFENQRTKREMKDAVIRFTQKIRENQGVALVFYAGHGMQVRGENYLVPIEAELKTEADMDDEALTVNYLMAQLDLSRNPFNIVIFDSCRDNPISRGWRSAGGRGLAPIDAPVGSVIIFSTAPGKVASDGSGRNGLFTKHLLANLPSPGLSLEEMIKQVSRGVSEESSKGGINQTPWWNSSFTGTFCFGGCVDTAQLNDIESIRKEKALLEDDVKRAQAQSAEQRDILAAQNAQSKVKQAELEARIKQLELESQKATKQVSATDDLAATKAQLQLLQLERTKAEEAQRNQSEVVQQLVVRRKELDQKTAEIEAMTKRLAELERDKLEKERQLDDERSKKRLLEEQRPETMKKIRVDIPPTL